uniref:protein disulfide-isomerase n=1 Tax=Cryptosporidium parvum TaxID=5807 RepID=Q27553_CRYPV|nr:protein disulphide isomerase precursor [Cryptosporidium parvum]
MIGIRSLVSAAFLGFSCLSKVVLGGDEAHFISEHITSLTSSNFEDFIKSKEHVIVTFFAPWCGHCTALEPEFKATCAEISKLSPPVHCGSVDATENMELAQQYGVSGYPTIKFFSGIDSVQNYSGARSKDAFIKYIKKLTGPAVQVAESEEAIKTIFASSSSAFVGRFTSKDSAEYAVFEKVASGHREHNYAFIAFFQEGEQKLEVLHKDEEPVSLPMPKTVEELEAKISIMNVPLFSAISAENYSLYMSREGYTPGSVVLTRTSPSMLQTLERLQLITEKSMPLFSLDTEQFGSHATQHLLIEKFPGLVIQSVNVPSIRYMYGPAKFDSVEPLKEFMKQVSEGKHELSIKSEPIPAEQSGPVTVVVGKTFEEIVFRSDKDVLLEIYAQWCGHCKNLEPIYNQLGEEYKDNDKVVIAKINGPQNDIPYEGFSPRAFPTILFVKAGTRTPIPYDGKRTVEAFKEFISEHSSFPQEKESRDEL